jgi:radical SAM superfamily enzyme YgiQ (UPF0313 family)
MRAKKVLLVSANVYKSPEPVYPLGVSYLKTFMEKALTDFEIETFDMNFGSPETLGEELRNGAYGFVGLSLRNIDDNNLFECNSFVAWYKQLVECIRRNSDACLIVGGAGYSIFPAILLEELQADFGIKGEGETSLTLLLRALSEGGSYDDIEGLTYRNKEGHIVVNPRKHYEHNLALRLEDKWLSYYWDNSGMLNLQTKRGCPHHCIYCSYPVIEGHQVRRLDIDQVVESLRRMYFEKGITYVFFTDSVFNMDKSYNRTLCQRIIDSGVKISWGAYFSPHDLTHEELLLYKQSGLTHIEFGTESFSDHTLALYGKKFSWNDVVESSHLCDDLGIFYAHFMILAGYGETEASLDETFEHSRQMDNTVIFPYVGMRIYPHTPLYEYALQEGRIQGEKDLLAPCYYVSREVDVDTIKTRAYATGARWIFPGDEASDDMEQRFRKRRRRGPLWQYLKY